LGLIDNLRIARTSYEDILNIIRVPKGCDCLFISCTNMPVVKYISDLERRYKIPVVTSNQASMWSALKIIHDMPLEGYGKLFEI
jgi:maleate cis-trans isomerase